MKKTLLLLASVALLLVSCQKENFVEQLGGRTTEATFSVSVDSGVATRAAVDGDGAAASVNRCIMEIYYGDALFTRKIVKVTDKKATFTAQVVSNRTYTVAFWADKVDATTEAGLQVDKYYTTNATGGLQSISIKKISDEQLYVGNDDARDAFYHVGEYTVAQAGSSFGGGEQKILLKRPFAQMNVITTDWDIVSAPVATLAPEQVNVIIKNPLVKFNAVTGEASADANTATLNYTADVYVAPASTGTAPANEKTLSMDYLFAPKTDKAFIDIDWKAKHGTDTDVAHTFAAVPYQRNYRTNIKGKLLTTTGQWTVTVEPTWTTPEYDVPYYVATSIQDAQNYISSQNTEQAKAVDLSNVVPTTSDFDPNVEDKTIKFVLKTTSPKNLVNFTLPAIPQSVIEAGCTGWKIEHETNYPTKNVGVNAPEGTRVVIDAPNSHVTVTGTSYAQIIGTTGENTLVIPQGVSVAQLTIAKGGLEIHGTVAAASVTGTISNVFVRECENLSQDVYDALKDYIAPNYKGTKNTDGSWNIALEDFWPNFAAEEFSAIDQSGKTMTISTPAELALLAKNINAGTSYAGYTISISGNLDMSAHYWIPINAYNGYLSGATINGAGNAVISNLKINKCVNNNTSGYNYYSGFIGQTVGKLTFKDLTFSGADVKVDNGSGIAVVLGLTYSDALFDNVKVVNSVVSSNTKVGALVGFTGGDCDKVKVKNCALENVTVKAAYSYALMVGLINVRDQVAFEGNNVVDSNTHAVYDEVVGHEEENIEETKDIKGYTYGVDGTNLWVTGVQDAWAEVRSTPTPKMTIDNVEYSVYGDVFYHANGVVVDVCTVAKIGNTEYKTLKEAVAAVGAEETTITMLRDIKFTESVNIGTKKIILNTNGMNLDATGLRAIEIYGGKLTVNGDGRFFAHNATGDNNAILNLYSGELVVNEVYLEGTNTCIGVTGGTATINNATMKALDGGCCVFATNDGVIDINGMIFTCEGDDPNGPGSCWARDGGTVNVYGGTFNAAPLNKVTHELETDQADYCLYDYFDAYPTKYAQTPGRIYVYGGTFKNFNPADNYSHHSFLAEGYQSVQDGNNWIVSAINN